MRVFLVSLIGVLLLSPAASAQPAPVEHWGTLETWVDAIHRHEAGEDDASVRAVASVTVQEFEATLPYLVFTLERALGNSGTRPFDDLFRRLHGDITLTSIDAQRLRSLLARITGPDIGIFFKRAAMLHTDIALFDPNAQLTTREGSGHLAADGRARGDEGRPWHWMLARSFLHLALTDVTNPRRPRLEPDSDPDVRVWYQAIANYLWSRRNYTEALPHIRAGLELFPGDAEIQFVRGLIHETQAGPHVQAAVEEQARQVRRAGMVYRSAVESAEKERAEAVGAFRRALAADPGHLEARLHLANVLNAEAEHDEAGVLAAAVARDSRQRWHRYFAFLFLGRAEESRDRATEARAAYTEASALYSDAQAPRIALSQLDIRAGDRPAALRLFEFLSEERDPDADPWWVYNSVRAPNADLVWIERVRAAFRGSGR